MDRVAKWTITLGGIDTIGAVLLVCLFLFWVVLPLLGGGEIEASNDLEGASITQPGGRQPIHLVEDAYRRLAVTVGDDGTAIGFLTDTGDEFARVQAFDSTATAVLARDETLLLGKTSGEVQFVEVGFTADLMPTADVPASAQELPIGDSSVVDGPL